MRKLVNFNKSVKLAIVGCFSLVMFLTFQNFMPNNQNDPGYFLTLLPENLTKTTMTNGQYVFYSYPGQTINWTWYSKNVSNISGTYSVSGANGCNLPPSGPWPMPAPMPANHASPGAIADCQVGGTYVLHLQGLSPSGQTVGSNYVIVQVVSLSEYSNKPSPQPQTQSASDSMFDEQCYLNRYPDVAAAVRVGATTSFAHWIQYGEFEGRNPGCNNSAPAQNSFNATCYNRQNPDVAARYTGWPYIHWLQAGLFEGRAPGCVTPATNSVNPPTVARACTVTLQSDTAVSYGGLLAYHVSYTVGGQAATPSSSSKLTWTGTNPGTGQIAPQPYGQSNMNLWSVTYQTPGIQGTYTRQLVVNDPTGIGTCTSNTVTVKLLPGPCSVTLSSPPSVDFFGNIDFKMTYRDATGATVKPSANADVTWSGSNPDGTQIQAQAYGQSNVNEWTFPYNNILMAGQYTRKIVVSDPSGIGSCSSNAVSVSLNKPLPPPAGPDLGPCGVSKIAYRETSVSSCDNVAVITVPSYRDGQGRQGSNACAYYADLYNATSWSYDISRDIGNCFIDQQSNPRLISASAADSANAVYLNARGDSVITVMCRKPSGNNLACNVPGAGWPAAPGAPSNYSATDPFWQGVLGGSNSGIQNSQTGTSSSNSTNLGNAGSGVSNKTATGGAVNVNVGPNQLPNTSSGGSVSGPGLTNTNQQPSGTGGGSSPSLGGSTGGQAVPPAKIGLGNPTQIGTGSPPTTSTTNPSASTGNSGTTSGSNGSGSSVSGGNSQGTNQTGNSAGKTIITVTGGATNGSGSNTTPANKPAATPVPTPKPTPVPEANIVCKQGQGTPIYDIYNPPMNPPPLIRNARCCNRKISGGVLNPKTGIVLFFCN